MSKFGVHTDFLFNLSAQDMVQVRDLVRGHFRSLHRRHGSGALSPIFARIDNIDPPKSDIRTVAAVRAYQRHALATVIDRNDRKVYEVVVNISAHKVVSADHRPGVRPNILFEEFEEMEKVCAESKELQNALRARGITDFNPELLQVDPLSSGYFGMSDEEGRRLATGFVYYLDHPLDNGYAHPVTGLTIYVDLDRMEVFKINDYDPQGTIPIPQTDHKSYGGTLHQWYSPLLASQPKMEVAKPLEIVQKDGPSFEISGAAGKSVHATL